MAGFLEWAGERNDHFIATFRPPPLFQALIDTFHLIYHTVIFGEEQFTSAFACMRMGLRGFSFTMGLS